MKKNDGYSLVEMLIVLAIIMLLTGMAYLSLSVLSSAKARDKAIEFDNELATVAAKARNMNAGFVDSATGIVYDQYGIVIYKPVTGSGLFEAPAYYNPTLDYYVVDCSEAKKFSKRVGLVFNGTTNTGSQLKPINNDGSGVDAISVIRFNRRGECMNGYGTYTFTTDRNSSGVASTKLRQNGSHEAR
jgi:prepilin-type N-terminal cleavage/methylation domain-containing protein